MSETKTEKAPKAKPSTLVFKVHCPFKAGDGEDRRTYTRGQLIVVADGSRGHKTATKLKFVKQLSAPEAAAHLMKLKVKADEEKAAAKAAK